MSAVQSASPASRLWAVYDPSPVPPILQAALECFVSVGYHGTSMRTLAEAAGLSVAGLYHHYPSKQLLLVELMERAMNDLFERSTAALLEAGDSVEQQLGLHVECLVRFQAHRADLAFLAASEIRSLSSTDREMHIARRDRQQRILDRIVLAGVEAGIFRTEDPRDSSRAIVTMCTGVAQWYRLGGTLTPDALAQRYVILSRRLLGVAI